MLICIDTFSFGEKKHSTFGEIRLALNGEGLPRRQPCNMTKRLGPKPVRILLLTGDLRSGSAIYKLVIYDVTAERLFAA